MSDIQRRSSIAESRLLEAKIGEAEWKVKPTDVSESISSSSGLLSRRSEVWRGGAS
jgi:hypothetical protein